MGGIYAQEPRCPKLDRLQVWTILVSSVQQYAARFQFPGDHTIIIPVSEGSSIELDIGLVHSNKLEMTNFASKIWVAHGIPISMS